MMCGYWMWTSGCGVRLVPFITTMAVIIYECKDSPEAYAGLSKGGLVSAIF